MPLGARRRGRAPEFDGEGIPGVDTVDAEHQIDHAIEVGRGVAEIGVDPSMQQIWKSARAEALPGARAKPVRGVHRPISAAAFFVDLQNKPDMKNKIKKLVVNKKTISNLSVADMEILGGLRTFGNGQTCMRCQSINCTYGCTVRCTLTICGGTGCLT